MVKTTVMDAVLTEAETKVVIHRHPTDFHTLSEDVGRRVVSTLEKTPAGCPGPAATKSINSRHLRSDFEHHFIIQSETFANIRLNDAANRSCS